MTSYPGCQFFLPLSEAVSIPLDQLNLVISLFSALPIAVLFKHFCSRSKCSSKTRHLVSILGGFAILLFMIGLRQTTQLFCITTIIFAIITLPMFKQISHHLTLAFSMSVLASAHITRLFSGLETDNIDWTIPFLIFVQKFTGIAYSLQDGRTEKYENLPEKGYRKQYAVRKPPTALEFYSYIFNFYGVFAGPNSFFVDFIDFIENRQEKVTNTKMVIGKCFAGVLFIILSEIGMKLLPASLMSDASQVSEFSFGYILLYSVGCIYPIRFKFYFFWLLADSINNAAGFGYNNSTKTWDLLSNIKPLELETCDNVKTWTRFWNIQTAKWLRLVVFERSSKTYRNQLTYLLSVVWHGFFPGYYVLFILGYFTTEAHKKVNKFLTPWFDKNYPRLYKLLCVLTLHVVVSYGVLNHVSLTFERVLIYNKHCFGYGYLIIFAGLMIPWKSFVPQVKLETEEKEKSK